MRYAGGTSLANRRVGFLDELRGLCLLLMIIYHGAYDIIYLFNVDIPLFHWGIINAAQSFVAGIFIFVSGICCRYSHNNIKRGAIAVGVGVLMTIVTLNIMQGQAIYFGILHFLGVSMILFGLLKKLLDKIPPFLGLCIMLILLAFTWTITKGYLGFFGIFQIPIYSELYNFGWLFWLGLPSATFMSADYFPLLPWVFCFFAGSYLGVYFKQNDMPAFFYRDHIPALQPVGKHSLAIYILHQPVVYGALWVIFKGIALIKPAI